MRMSVREIMLAWLTAVVLLFGGTWYFYLQHQIAGWKEAKEQQAVFEQRIMVSERLLSRQDEWDERLRVIRTRLPEYSLKEEVTSDFLKTLEQRANKHGLTLLKARPSDEKKVDDLYELTINYSWEGNLSSLIYFLYALQKEEVNLDVRQLNVTTDTKNRDNLKGTLSVDFAYTRMENKDNDG